MHRTSSGARGLSKSESESKLELVPAPFLIHAASQASMGPGVPNFFLRYSSSTSSSLMRRGSRSCGPRRVKYVMVLLRALGISRYDPLVGDFCDVPVLARGGKVLRSGRVGSGESDTGGRRKRVKRGREISRLTGSFYQALITYDVLLSA